MKRATLKNSSQHFLSILGAVASSIVFVSSASAQKPAASAASSAPAAASGKKTTDVSFEDVLVQGKYHFADEAVTTVENDKVLDALLGVRTDFKDRLKKSAGTALSAANGKSLMFQAPEFGQPPFTWGRYRSGHETGS